MRYVAGLNFLAMVKILTIIMITVLVVDIFAYRAVYLRIRNLKPKLKKWIPRVYWGISAIIVISFLLLFITGLPKGYRIFIAGLHFVLFATKLVIFVFVLFNDMINGFIWTKNKIIKKEPTLDPVKKMSRADFITKSALIVASIPLTTMTFGIVSGAHDYRVRRRQVFLKNLPAKFDGLRVCQISDIHSGSFYNKTAVAGGVDLAMAEKPDIVFFTGDLINDLAEEIHDYYDVFKRVKAPMGVYSILGNHDYGEYHNWPSKEAKAANLEKVKLAHKELGWDLLLNDSRILKVGDEEIGLIGVENWGTGNFPKYGDLAKAYQGVKDHDVKILLSHDPSHWDAQVRENYKDIALMLAGHTHGMQLGVEWGDFKWSPVQYRYKQWAGHYETDGQQLYVNRGYGFLGYPGRVGILPEITILELKPA